MSLAKKESGAESFKTVVKVTKVGQKLHKIVFSNDVDKTMGAYQEALASIESAPDARFSFTVARCSDYMDDEKAFALLEANDIAVLVGSVFELHSIDLNMAKGTQLRDLPLIQQMYVHWKLKTMPLVKLKTREKDELLRLAKSFNGKLVLIIDSIDQAKIGSDAAIVKMFGKYASVLTATIDHRNPMTKSVVLAVPPEFIMALVKAGRLEKNVAFKYRID